MGPVWTAAPDYPSRGYSHYGCVEVQGMKVWNCGGMGALKYEE